MQTLTISLTELGFERHAFDYFDLNEEEVVNALERTNTAFTFRRDGDEMLPTIYFTLYIDGYFEEYAAIINVDENAIVSIIDGNNARRNETNRSSDRNSTRYYTIEWV